MQYRQHGYHWDGSPAYSWHCLSENSGRFGPRCWHVIWDGERPWTLDLYRQGLVGAYVERYGSLPFETQRPHADFAVQPRLF